MGVEFSAPFFIIKKSARFNSFTYATSSEHWGDGYQYGKYAVKVYTIDGVLIYQADNGTTNINKTPLGGIINQSSPAESMAISIANPITLYYGGYAVINQGGHSRDLYSYYWSSYSRGTDGRYSGGINEPQRHNIYLDGYIPLRVKSIYDPCPYLYRIPSNGTYNQFGSNPGWTDWSYLGGLSWNINTMGESWLVALGIRNYSEISTFVFSGRWGFYALSTIGTNYAGYLMMYSATKEILINRDAWYSSSAISVRCIEN